MASSWTKRTLHILRAAGWAEPAAGETEQVDEDTATDADVASSLTATDAEDLEGAADSAVAADLEGAADLAVAEDLEGVADSTATEGSAGETTTGLADAAMDEFDTFDAFDAFDTIANDFL